MTTAFGSGRTGLAPTGSVCGAGAGAGIGAPPVVSRPCIGSPVPDRVMAALRAVARTSGPGPGSDEADEEREGPEKTEDAEKSGAVDTVEAASDDVVTVRPRAVRPGETSAVLAMVM
ncbi:hypothetical protein AN220_13020, partial [Streptomyces nanshensis]